MLRRIRYRTLLPVYFFVLAVFLLVGIGGSRVITVWSENATVQHNMTVVVDAGHGGVDGGATSCTGVLESQFNLEIAQRVNDLLNLLGINTIMIRQTDCSVYTEGETIAQKKVSDLKERARIVNSTDNAILVSIHQNTFPQGKYSGAQVFYGEAPGSQLLAKSIQSAIIQTLNPGSNRQIKRADNIYLMQHVNCPAVLIECGFLSNPQEEYLLRTKSYQQKLSCVIACTISMDLTDT